MSRPQNVGILGIEVYFPKTCVSQASLEQFDKAGDGKYRIGLGQQSMAFVGDREDINTICLTALHNLLEKYNINPSDVGRLEVGTETIIDKSKATKTVLMDLFKDSGNFNVEGIDTKNACYGGTAALSNAINWIESSSWDGRYAIVLAGDIAVYAPGPARPTGGCGAVAMLLGPNAPMVIEPGVRGTHMEHVYDFYKPDPSVEYPTVDGRLSVTCYLRAVDNCFEHYSNKFQAKEKAQFTLDKADYFVFHAPYNKLVQRSFARMMYNDFMANPNRPEFASAQRFASLKKSETWTNAEVDKAFMELSKPLYQSKVVPSTVLPKELGNIYTGSLYAGLCSLIFYKADELVGKRIVLFSYGSGLAATMFSIRVTGSIKKFAQALNLKDRLASRKVVDPVEFTRALELRRTRHGTHAYKPSDSLEDMFPGTYYIESVDDKHRRHYIRKPNQPAKL